MTAIRIHQRVTAGKAVDTARRGICSIRTRGDHAMETFT